MVLILRGGVQAERAGVRLQRLGGGTHMGGGRVGREEGGEVDTAARESFRCWGCGPAGPMNWKNPILILPPGSLLATTRLTFSWTPPKRLACQVAKALIEALEPGSPFPLRRHSQSRRFFDALCLCAFHSPQPRILSPVESTIKSIGPSWDRIRGGTATIWFRRERVVWSGGLEVEAHQAEQRVQEPLGLAERQAEDDPQRQRGPDREVRVSTLPSAETVLRWYPRGNRILAQPDRDVPAAPEATLVLPPVPDSVLRLVLAVDSARLPCGHDVAPLISMMDRNPPPLLACPLTPIHAPMPQFGQNG